MNFTDLFNKSAIRWANALLKDREKFYSFEECERKNNLYAKRRANCKQLKELQDFLMLPPVYIYEEQKKRARKAVKLLKAVARILPNGAYDYEAIKVAGEVCGAYYWHFARDLNNSDKSAGSDESNDSGANESNGSDESNDSGANESNGSDKSNDVNNSNKLGGLVNSFAKSLVNSKIFKAFRKISTGVKFFTLQFSNFKNYGVKNFEISRMSGKI